MFEAKGEGYHYCENEACPELYILQTISLGTMCVVISNVKSLLSE